jgi:hypothetical protein
MMSLIAVTARRFHTASAESGEHGAVMLPYRAHVFSFQIVNAAVRAAR